MDSSTPALPTIGRLLHFNIGTPGSPVFRPAIVVRTWETSLNLQVFTDGENDRGALQTLGLVAPETPVPSVLWVKSARGGGGSREWRWPERV